MATGYASNGRRSRTRFADSSDARAARGVNGRERRGARTIALLALAVSSACQSDRPFHAVAVYDAPDSGCSVRMEARGVVRSGRDLSDQAAATLTIRSTTAQRSAGPAPVTVQVALAQGRVLFGDEFQVQGTLPTRSREALASVLSNAGCSPVPDEVEELWSAIEGVLFGPKATLMSGQTKVLSVLSTSFDP